VIQRDRSVVSAPRALTASDGPGRKQRAAVEKWIQGGRKKKRPSLDAYKAADVSVALERLFDRKCAYCESLYVTTQPIDVEHWRPKAEVNVEGPQKTRYGYEWLAAEWTNLLPSCIDCNRARNQVVLLPGETGAVETRVSGKANQFPLFEEAKRLAGPASPDSEDPCLLDPCIDDGKTHLRFLENGVVRPRDEEGTKDSQAQRRRRRAMDSIRVYALNRRALVDARREQRIILGTRFELIRALIRIETQVRSAAGTKILRKAADEIQTLIEHEVHQLLGLARPDRPYALMTGQFVAEFLETIGRS